MFDWHLPGVLFPLLTDADADRMEGSRLIKAFAYLLAISSPSKVPNDSTLPSAGSCGRTYVLSSCRCRANCWLSCDRSTFNESSFLFSGINASMHALPVLESLSTRSFAPHSLLLANDILSKPVRWSSFSVRWAMILFFWWSTSSNWEIWNNREERALDKERDGERVDASQLTCAAVDSRRESMVDSSRFILSTSFEICEQTYIIDYAHSLTGITKVYLCFCGFVRRFLDSWWFGTDGVKVASTHWFVVVHHVGRACGGWCRPWRRLVHHGFTVGEARTGSVVVVVGLKGSEVSCRGRARRWSRRFCFFFQLITRIRLDGGREREYSFIVLVSNIGKGHWNTLCHHFYVNHHHHDHNQIENACILCFLSPRNLLGEWGSSLFQFLISINKAS